MLQVHRKGHFDFVVTNIYTKMNQSVENAGVAFVKGTNERNEFFEKFNNQ